MSYYKDSVYNNTVLVPEIVFDSCIPGYLMKEYGLINEQAQIKAAEMAPEFIARADYHYYHDVDHFKDRLNSRGDYKHSDSREELKLFFRHWCDSWMKKPFRESYQNIQNNLVE